MSNEQSFQLKKMVTLLSMVWYVSLERNKFPDTFLIDALPNRILPAGLNAICRKRRVIFNVAGQIPIANYKIIKEIKVHTHIIYEYIYIYIERERERERERELTQIEKLS